MNKDKDFNFKDDSEINELRKKRDDLYDKASEIQHQIDRLILDKMNFNDLVGKYFFISDLAVYIKVNKVERLYKGCELTVERFSVIEENDLIYFTYNSDDTLFRTCNNIKANMIEISKEKYENELDKAITKIKNKK